MSPEYLKDAETTTGAVNFGNRTPGLKAPQAAVRHKNNGIRAVSLRAGPGRPLFTAQPELVAITRFNSFFNMTGHPAFTLPRKTAET
jgi:hypothetical protein